MQPARPLESMCLADNRCLVNHCFSCIIVGCVLWKTLLKWKEKKKTTRSMKHNILLCDCLSQEQSICPLSWQRFRRRWKSLQIWRLQMFSVGIYCYTAMHEHHINTKTSVFFFLTLFFLPWTSVQWQMVKWYISNELCGHNKTCPVLHKPKFFLQYHLLWQQTQLLQQCCWCFTIQCLLTSW